MAMPLATILLLLSPLSPLLSIADSNYNTLDAPVQGCTLLLYHPFLKLGTGSTWMLLEYMSARASTS